MPPLRSVSSCSPSARARTVTAHSLKAIGIGDKGGGGWVCQGPARAALKLQRQRQDVVILSEIPGIAKPTCKIAESIPPRCGLNLRLCNSPAGSAPWPPAAVAQQDSSKWYALAGRLDAPLPLRPP